jgi:peptidoglycan hydrolase-like protein with peptidoglycan-binding domain
VRAFQRGDALLVDGIVGPQTWDALFGITPPAQPAGMPASVPSSAATSGYTVPSGIVQCESGGNYSAVNGQSGAGGAYQIMPSTWQAYGGQGLPQNAPKAEQDRIAADIYAAQGSSAWTC